MSRFVPRKRCGSSGPGLAGRQLSSPAARPELLYPPLAAWAGSGLGRLEEWVLTATVWRAQAVLLDMARESVILGAYIPAWMLAAFVGVFATLIVRMLLVKSRLDPEVPAKPVIYLCLLGAMILTSWLVLQFAGVQI